jgi:hypothetical protein
MSTSRFSLDACRNNGVREVMMTVWLNDNAECDLFTNLLGLSFFAELCFDQNADESKLRARFEGEPDTEWTTEEKIEEPVLYADVDYTALNTAAAAFEALAETDYTPESWHAAKNFYEAAVAMRDGTYPQNAVTVAAWKLEDAVGELIPAPKAEKTETPTEAGKAKRGVPVKRIIPAAAVALVGAATGAVAGILMALRHKKR